ncbi:MAG: hypothetical protein VCD00_10115 [Candidatus Hydrogenedentota bacterium]
MIHSENNRLPKILKRPINKGQNTPTIFPWTFIIDKKGVVRMNRNYTTAKHAHDMLSKLLME